MTGGPAEGRRRRGALRRAVLAGALLLAAILTVSALAAALVLRLSLPVRRGTLAVPGLTAAVEIRFDGRARPFVRAATLGDALAAEGVLHVRERLFQMELLRRAARGRLAEALGEAGLETDRGLWRAGVPQLGPALLGLATSETRELVDRYLAGVNAALAALRARPPELLLLGIPLRPWEPLDVFSLGALLAWDSARNADAELLRLELAAALPRELFGAFLPEGAPLPAPEHYEHLARAGRRLSATRGAPELAARGPRALLTLGSNGFVVAPSRSASGHALFAFDSHDALSLPNVTYEVHLFFGNGEAIRGWSVPGLPGVINGFTRGAAWGFTNIGDSQDLFLEERHPADHRRFRTGPAFLPARRERVEIPVRGRSEPEVLEILHTPRGPLIREDPPLALAWIGHRLPELGLGLDALFALSRAGDWPALDAALDRFPAPSANATCADTGGHIARRTVGVLPVRGRGVGAVPQPGWDLDATWRGLLPPSELPRAVDPPEGFAAAANARVDPPGGPVRVSADNAPGYRLERIVEVLGASPAHTAVGLRRLQMDRLDGQARRLLPALLPELPEGAPERALLATWLGNPVDDPDLEAPVLYRELHLALARVLFGPLLGETLLGRLLRQNYVLDHALDGIVLGPGDSPFWRGDRRARVREALARTRRAVDARAEEIGRAPRLGDVQEVTLPHELARAVPLLAPVLSRGPFAWGGGPPTVGRASYRYAIPFRVRHAATVRVVVEMARPPAASAVIPGGQSGHPFDPHYDDQVAPWLRGETDALAPSPEALPEAGLRLVPKGA